MRPTVHILWESGSDAGRAPWKTFCSQPLFNEVDIYEALPDGFAPCLYCAQRLARLAEREHQRLAPDWLRHVGEGTRALATATEARSA
jgi:hypothetical protein